MSWLNEDLLGLREVPTLHGGLSFNGHLGLIELSLPFLKDINALVNSVNGDFGLKTEDSLDVNLAADFVTDFIRDRFEKVLHLVLSLVDVTRDGPDELETIQEGGKSLFNDRELSS